MAKMKNKILGKVAPYPTKIVLFLLIIITMVIISSSLELNQFSDSSTIFNLSYYLNGGDKYKNISIVNYANVSSATLFINFSKRLSFLLSNGSYNGIKDVVVDENNIAYFTVFTGDQVVIMNVSDLNNLNILNITSDIDAPESLDVYNDVLYITGWSDKKLYAYNITDKSNPTLIINFTNINRAHRIHIDKENYRLYVTHTYDTGDDNFTVFNISNPNSITVLGAIYDNDNLENVGDIYAVGDIVYTTQENYMNFGGNPYYPNGRLTLWNVTNMSNIVKINESAVELSQAYEIEVSGNYAYIADHPNGLKIYNITDTTNIVQVNTGDNIEIYHALQLYGDILYGTDNANDTVYIVNITDKTAPFVIDSIKGAGADYYLDNPQGMYVKNETIYVASATDDKLSILQYKYLENFTLKLDNNIVYQNLTKINQSTTIDLNITILQNCIDTCSVSSGIYCLCEFNFSSQTAGIITISDLNITYVELISFTNEILANSYYLDLSSDGTNYGETSDGFATGDSKLYNMSPLSISRQQILIIRYTALDGSVDIYVDETVGADTQIGNIPADASGNGVWKTIAFLVNTTELNNNPFTINLTAGVNTEEVYIDWLVLADSVNDSDLITKENSFIVFYSNISGNTVDFRGKVWNTSDELLGTFYENNYTYSLDTSFGTNRILVYRVGDISGNYSFKFESNTSDDQWLSGSIKEIEIDSITPVINTITTDLNVLVGNVYNISINVTEKNDNHVNISANDSSFQWFNLESSGEDLWINNSLQYSKNYTKVITIIAMDVVNHSHTYSFNVKASSIETNISNRVLNNTMTFYNYFNISDTSVNKDLISKVSFNNIAEGDAYIDENNQSYNISDNTINNIHTILNNGTTLTFGNNNKSISWITDYWNNTANNYLSFNNYLYYNISSAVTLEWENTGINNLRLFYINPTSNFNTSTPINIFVRVPLRTSYSSTNSSTDLYECTTTINWGAKTCGGYTEITDAFYEENNLTYHDTYDYSNYPTQDENADDNLSYKTHMYIKINLSQERMYKIDLDESNAEPSWSTAPGDGDGDGGGGGGGGGEEDEEVLGNETITITFPKSEPWWSKLSFDLPFLGVIGDVISYIIGGIVGFFYDIYLTIKTGFTPTSTFILLTALTIVSIIFILISGEPKKGLKSR